MRIVLYGIASLVSLAMSAGSAANYSLEPVQSQPAFRTGVDLVRLDVSVLDKNRRPVDGLTLKDFSIRENGKPEQIVNFLAVEIPGRTSRSVSAAGNVPGDGTRNVEASQGRIIVVVMDDALIPFNGQITKSARDIGRRVIGSLEPTDLASVVFTQDSRHSQGLTLERAPLLAAVNAFVAGGHDPTGYAGSEISELRYYWSALNTLKLLTEQLSAIPDRRKTVVYVSIGVPIDLSLLGPGHPTGPMSDLAGRLKEVLAGARESNVDVYPVDPSGVGGLRFEIERRQRNTGNAAAGSSARASLYTDFLEAVADNTGGRAVVRTNEFGPAIAQILTENGSYYLLAYRPSNAARDGKFRKIEVRVNKPGLAVKTRLGYYAPESR